MAATDNADTERRDWKKRESFSSAMIQIVVVGVLLAGASFYFIKRGERKKAIVDGVKAARLAAQRDNPEDLARALNVLETEVFTLDASAKDGLALAADIETERWLIHRIAGADAKAREYLDRADKGDSRTEERYGSKLSHLLAAGKSGDAATLAEDLRKQGVNKAKIWYGLAQAHEAQGALALSREAYFKSTERDWKNPRYYAGFGEALIDQGDYYQAIEVLKKSLSTANPEHVRSRLALALARIYKREFVKEAQDTLAELKALGEDGLTPGLRARALAVEAELANFETRTDDALKLADASLAANPAEKYALIAKARALALKQDPGALEAFKAAAAADPTAQNTYFTGATLLKDAGNVDGALALLDTYQGVFAKVELPALDGKVQNALERDDKYWIARGDVLRAAGKDLDAMASYDKAIAANSVNLARAHFSKGALLFAQKKLEEATASLALVTPEDGSGQIAEAYMTMGDLHFEQKNYLTGCQSYAWALIRLKAQQSPREKLNEVVAGVSKKLVAYGQKAASKEWEEQAQKMIQ